MFNNKSIKIIKLLKNNIKKFIFKVIIFDKVVTSKLILNDI